MTPQIQLTIVLGHITLGVVYFLGIVLGNSLLFLAAQAKSWKEKLPPLLPPPPTPKIKPVKIPKPITTSQGIPEPIPTPQGIPEPIPTPQGIEPIPETIPEPIPTPQGIPEPIPETIPEPITTPQGIPEPIPEGTSQGIPEGIPELPETPKKRRRTPKHATSSAATQLPKH